MQVFTTRRRAPMIATGQAAARRADASEIDRITKTRIIKNRISRIASQESGGGRSRQSISSIAIEAKAIEANLSRSKLAAMPNQYLLENAWSDGRARLDAVEEFLDPGTIALMERRGVGAGWTCLELGAGGGSIAKWLSARVGAAGRVLATDLDTRHLVGLVGLANVEILRHDIVAEPLREAEFDLVHARLVLEHLRERDEVLRKLVRALKPGGWLLLESVDYASAVAISERGAQEHTHSQAARLRAFEARGVDANYGRRLPRALREMGLVDIGNEGRVFVMEGGSPGARWFELSMRQLRGWLVGEGGMSDTEVDRMLELFADPGWAAFSPIIVACWGRVKGG